VVLPECSKPARGRTYVRNPPRRFEGPGLSHPPGRLPVYPQTTAVLLALAEDPQAWRYGYELCQQTCLKSGSMYPILMQLADRGLLETGWENDAPLGRPARHLYRLTGQDLEQATELAAAPARSVKAKRARMRLRLEGA